MLRVSELDLSLMLMGFTERFGKKVVQRNAISRRILWFFMVEWYVADIRAAWNYEDAACFWKLILIIRRQPPAGN